MPHRRVPVFAGSVPVQVTSKLSRSVEGRPREESDSATMETGANWNLERIEKLCNEIRKTRRKSRIKDAYFGQY